MSQTLETFTLLTSYDTVNNKITHNNGRNKKDWNYFRQSITYINYINKYIKNNEIINKDRADTTNQ